MSDALENYAALLHSGYVEPKSEPEPEDTELARSLHADTAEQH